MSISPAELILLDSVGYAAVPEPGALTSLASLALGWLAVRRKRREKHSTIR